MASKKENKLKNLNQPKSKKTVAEQVQLRLGQLDKKSSNISKQIEVLQKRLDNTSKLKVRIEKLKVDLAKVKKAKELELDEISLMCSLYGKTCQTNGLKQEQKMVEPTVS